MKAEGRNAVGSVYGFPAFAASLLDNVATLSGIRKNKGKLTAQTEAVQKFNEQWEGVYQNLLSAVSRETGTLYAGDILSEMAKSANPNTVLKKYGNRGYGFSEQELSELKALVEAIRTEMPTDYFETKFERPVLFEEFASAIVPASISEDIKQYLREKGLQVFEYAQGGMSREEAFREAIRSEGIRFRTTEGKTLAEVNERFNEQLEAQIAGELPQGHIYQLGMPSTILQSTGIPNLPIELASSHIDTKVGQDNHPYSMGLLRDLPHLLQEPIAIFRYGDQAKSQNIIVEVEHDGKQLLVGLHINQNRRGIEVNDIRGLFPKDTHQWLNWIQQGKALYLNKKVSKPR